MKSIFAVCLILICLILCAFQCKKDSANCHRNKFFKNESIKDLYVITSYLYPDTVLSKGYPNPILDPNTNKILMQSSKLLWTRDCIETIFRYSIPSDTLMVYVFDAGILESTSWDTIRANNLYLKRYDLSLQDLQMRNWTIIYP